MITSKSIPSGIAPIFIPPKESDRINFPLAKNAMFCAHDPSKPITLPQNCKTAVPVNGKVTCEYKHRNYLFSLIRPFYRGSSQVCKGWVALFPVTAKPETTAKIVILPGEKESLYFHSEEELNSFLADSVKTIAAAPPNAIPKPTVQNPLAPSIPNFYTSAPSFFTPMQNNLIMPLNSISGKLF